jgi:hypothetical protein
MMTKHTESYLKVPYDLRTAKQIERRMIADALQILSRSNFSIGDYQYTGLGSIFFVDFILFHKLLGIHRMLSVEISRKIKKRVQFNCPYGNIKLEFGRIGDFISQLNKDLKHIVWFDYDYALNTEVMMDVILASSELSPGSIILITVDLEMPKRDKGLGEEDARRTPQERMDYFNGALGRFFELDWDVRDFAQSRMPAVNLHLLQNAVKNGLTGRSEIEFLPLFNFVYADGHEMLTFGGVIGGPVERRLLEACDFSKAPYIRRSVKDDPYEIKVPILTRKERLHLDSEMPCPNGWKPKQFELADDAIKTYREIYRFYPAYAELLF